MRRIVMFNHVSADGYFASTDGNLDWVGSDPELDRASAGSLTEFDTMLLGRTYEMLDEYQFIVNPVILGNGRSMITGVAQRASLGLIESRTCKSGKILLRFGRRD